MNELSKLILLSFIASLSLGCASSIVDGSYTKTSQETLIPKQKDSVVDLYQSGDTPERSNAEIGIVNARSYVLEKGFEELKTQARELGGDAVIKISYERKISGDYLLDLYFINGTVVIWK